MSTAANASFIFECVRLASNTTQALWPFALHCLDCLVETTYHTQQTPPPTPTPRLSSLVPPLSLLLIHRACRSDFVY